MPDERETARQFKSIGDPVTGRRPLRHELRLALAMFVFGWFVSLAGPLLRERKSVLAMVDLAEALQDE